MTAMQDYLDGLLTHDEAVAAGVVVEIPIVAVSDEEDSDEEVWKSGPDTKSRGSSFYRQQHLRQSCRSHGRKGPYCDFRAY